MSIARLLLWIPVFSLAIDLAPGGPEMEGEAGYECPPSMAPLVIASVAGGAGRRAFGTTVLGGLVATTVLVVFFALLRYIVMQRLSEWRRPTRGAGLT